MGLAFKLVAGNPNLELVDAPISSCVIGQPAVTFSLSGIENNPALSAAMWIEITVDPGHGAAGIFKGKEILRFRLADLVKEGSIQPISIQMTTGLQRAWFWQQIQSRDSAG